MRRFFTIPFLYDWLLILFAASIPLGTRKLIVAGSDPYQSVFLYFTDLLFAGLFLFWLFSDAKRLVRANHILVPLGFLAAWLSLASVFSQDAWLGLYRSLKFAEYAFVFFIFTLPAPLQKLGTSQHWKPRFQFTHRFSLNRKKYVLEAIVASAVVQSVLAIAQFVFQRSLGLSWLGEQLLSPSLAGVAKIDVWGGKVIRAYGTFPHPNVLAAFLLLALFIAAFLLQKEKKGSLAALLFLASTPVITLALLLTFSRAVIALGVICLLLRLVKTLPQSKRFFIMFVLSLVLFAALLFAHGEGTSRLASFDVQNQSVALRATLVRNAFSVIRAHPLLGTGPGQFTLAEAPIVNHLHLPPWANQPVHTIYLLLASEAGLPALVFFIWFLYEVYATTPRAPSSWRFLLIAFFAIALTDHFFLTFQQGALLFWLTLGLAGSKVKLKGFNFQA